MDYSCVTVVFMSSMLVVSTYVVNAIAKKCITMSEHLYITDASEITANENIQHHASEQEQKRAKKSAQHI